MLAGGGGVAGLQGVGGFCLLLRACAQRLAPGTTNGVPKAES